MCLSCVHASHSLFPPGVVNQHLPLRAKRHGPQPRRRPAAQRTYWVYGLGFNGYLNPKPLTLNPKPQNCPAAPHPVRSAAQEWTQGVGEGLGLIKP
jgi:hypothetical protein